MRRNEKYFVFNKESDFAAAYFENTVLEKNRLVVGSERAEGFFISRLLDSREKSTEWYRLAFTARQQLGAFYRVTLYATDDPVTEDDGHLVDIADLILDKERTFTEKARLMKKFAIRTIENADDILLNDVQGRYMWFSIVAAGSQTFIDDIMVFFPRRTWTDYLPEIYRDSDKNMFLWRYLAIFQTLYDDLTRLIKDVPENLDIDLAGREGLDWIAKWLDISNSYVWSDEKLYELLKSAVDLYRRRGSKNGVLDFIRIYTGGEVYITENHALQPFLKDKALETLLTQLYGMNPYMLTILLKKEYVPDEKSYRALSHIINEVKPAQMELNLVALEPYMFLGSHIYIGINSELGKYRTAAFDGMTMSPLSAIISSDAHFEYPTGGN